MTVEESVSFRLTMSANMDDETEVPLNGRMQTVQGST